MAARIYFPSDKSRLRSPESIEKLFYDKKEKHCNKLVQKISNKLNKAGFDITAIKNVEEFLAGTNLKRNVNDLKAKLRHNNPFMSFLESIGLSVHDKNRSWI